MKKHRETVRFVTQSRLNMCLYHQIKRSKGAAQTAAKRRAMQVDIKVDLEKIEFF